MSQSFIRESTDKISIFSIEQLHLPPYAASLHFELYSTEKGEYYIQIFYRKEDEENLQPLNIPGCGEKCTLEQFYDLYEDIIPDDFEKECIDTQ